MNFVEAVPSAAAWARAVPAIAALRPGFLAPGAVILPGRVDQPRLRHRAAAGRRRTSRRTPFSGRFDFKLNNNWSSLRPRLPRPGHERRARRRHRPRRASPSESQPTRSSTCRASSADRTINEFKVGYNAAPTHDCGAVPTARRDFGNFVLNLSGSVANTGIAGQGVELRASPSRAAWSASTAPATAAAQPYDPVLADVRRLAELAARQSLREGRRRRPADPHGDRSAGRHHLHLPERERVPGQHAVDDSVPRRPQRAEPVQQRRDRRAPHQAGVLRRASRRTSGACARS